MHYFCVSLSLSLSTSMLLSMCVSFSLFAVKQRAHDFCYTSTWFNTHTHTHRAHSYSQSRKLGWEPTHRGHKTQIKFAVNSFYPRFGSSFSLCVPSLTLSLSHFLLIPPFLFRLMYFLSVDKRVWKIKLTKQAIKSFCTAFIPPFRFLYVCTIQEKKFRVHNSNVHQRKLFVCSFF